MPARDATSCASREQREGWGAKIIDRLAADLRREFPDMTGLSLRNLKYMRAFAQAWPAKSRTSFVQQAVAQLPWGHNIALLTKLKDREIRLWYATQAIENGWSRNVLQAQIASDLRRRQGNALTSFDHALPESDSELVRDAIKDPSSRQPTRSTTMSRRKPSRRRKSDKQRPRLRAGGVTQSLTSQCQRRGSRVFVPVADPWSFLPVADPGPFLPVADPGSFLPVADPGSFVSRPIPLRGPIGRETKDPGLLGLVGPLERGIASAA
jgi:predicted nuclease of restriction endonuclease-like (RecB) superfamily